MQFSIPSIAFAAIALLTAPVTAQSCSNLSVTGTGAPGTSLTFAITGAPAAAPTVILVGFGGTATTPNPIIDLGLAAPFVPVAGGTADAAGAFSASLEVPAMMTGQIAAHAQGVSISFTLPMGPPSLPLTLPISFCTSDVEAFSAGTPATN